MDGGESVHAECVVDALGQRVAATVAAAGEPPETDIRYFDGELVLAESAAGAPGSWAIGGGTREECADGLGYAIVGPGGQEVRDFLEGPAAAVRVPRALGPAVGRVQEVGEVLVRPGHRDRVDPAVFVDEDDERRAKAEAGDVAGGADEQVRAHADDPARSEARVDVNAISGQPAEEDKARLAVGPADEDGVVTETLEADELVRVGGGSDAFADGVSHQEQERRPQAEACGGGVRARTTG